MHKKFLLTKRVIIVVGLSLGGVLGIGATHADGPFETELNSFDAVMRLPAYVRKNHHTRVGEGRVGNGVVNHAHRTTGPCVQYTCLECGQYYSWCPSISQAGDHERWLDTQCGKLDGSKTTGVARFWDGASQEFRQRLLSIGLTRDTVDVNDW